ncbi:SDR family NAD(P)-dependent oxidoreductase [Thiohalomonas denitrificans]|uniref:SDR family NAD(P)-dependent oxidoreductase n=1 Tax=Thiohalomonas denitrificans TaxID=415747 RepID=UPI0026EFEADC|nr:SDR family NAD(P)-dependent oxidoreductase [Thiohalomonas denitrificans]
MRLTDGNHKPFAGLGPTVGLSVFCAPCNQQQTKTMLDDLECLGVRHLRLMVCVDTWNTTEGRRWYEWFLAAAAERAQILPVLTGGTVEFAEQAMRSFAPHLEAVEVVGPTPGETTLRAQLALQHNARPVIGLGVKNLATNIAALASAGALEAATAVTLHGFPENLPGCKGWSARIEEAEAALKRADCDLPLWMATGYSERLYADRGQLEAFADAATAPAARVYWHSTRDRQETSDSKRRFGFADAQGHSGLLLRLLEVGGLDQVLNTVQATRSAKPTSAPEPVALVTGGAGFIGANVADRLLSEGRRVLILDNLARPGTEQNLAWLQERHPERLEFRLGDVRDAAAVREAVDYADQVYHFAAQVAVTTSLDNPIGDFEVNSRGTLNLLEALRACPDPPSLLFTSTNKVYGALEDVALRATDSSYEPEDGTIRRSGVDEERRLEFCSPYGCSKGAADQYVLDYARTFGLPAAVFRMSCIYGPRQFGTEDQGWVAHFLIRALRQQPITIYGDGLQVRDVLFVDDLVDAMLLAHRQMPQIAGTAFNIGGGPLNTLSLKQLLALLEERQGEPPEVRFEHWRSSDQRYYVSNVGKFSQATGWQPRIPVAEGVSRLYDWLTAQNGLVVKREKRMVL